MNLVSVKIFQTGRNGWETLRRPFERVVITQQPPVSWLVLLLLLCDFFVRLAGRSRERHRTVGVMMCFFGANIGAKHTSSASEKRMLYSNCVLCACVVVACFSSSSASSSVGRMWVCADTRICGAPRTHGWNSCCARWFVRAAFYACAQCFAILISLRWCVRERGIEISTQNVRGVFPWILFWCEHNIFNDS